MLLHQTASSEIDFISAIFVAFASRVGPETWPSADRPRHLDNGPDDTYQHGVVVAHTSTSPFSNTLIGPAFAMRPEHCPPTGTGVAFAFGHTSGACMTAVVRLASSKLHDGRTAHCVEKFNHVKLAVLETTAPTAPQPILTVVVILIRWSGRS